jgi:PAT family beta-lactamase induction signal transducer AmpG
VNGKDGASSGVTKARGWRIYRQPAMLRMLALGFSAGLPYLLVFGTLSFRLREAGIERSTIGFLSWILLAYAFKWAWAPVVDRLHLPFLTRRLGKRRAWLLLAQCCVAAGLLAMAVFDARTNLFLLASAALFTAFASATQDIALDAFRIESAPPGEQAALAAAYQVGYRLGMIWAGAGAFWLAASVARDPQAYDSAAWTLSYLVMAVSMLPGALAALWTREAPGQAQGAAGIAPEHSVRGTPGSGEASGGAGGWVLSYVDPFVELVRRYRWHALGLVALISFYRMPSIVMGIMANVFYRDIGFTKDEVALVAKFAGVWMSLLGGGLAGVWVPRFGLRPMLFVAAAASSASILFYALIATTGPDLRLLALAISADNFSEGVAGTAFIAFLSGLTRAGFSATQYALLTSIAVFLPKIVAGFSGMAVDRLGYAAFFCTCSAIGLVTLVLLALVLRTLPDQRFSKR